MGILIAKSCLIDDEALLINLLESRVPPQQDGEQNVSKPCTIMLKFDLRKKD
jgi:hypothetical protein